MICRFEINKNPGQDCPGFDFDRMQDFFEAPNTKTGTMSCVVFGEGHTYDDDR